MLGNKWHEKLDNALWAISPGVMKELNMQRMGYPLYLSPPVTPPLPPPFLLSLPLSVKPPFSDSFYHLTSCLIPILFHLFRKRERKWKMSLCTTSKNQHLLPPSQPPPPSPLMPNLPSLNP